MADSDFKIKQFNPDEINRAIAKLQRRIEEVESLRSDGVKFDDQRRHTAEANIRSAILEIFGSKSFEYDAHQSHEIWKGGHRAGSPPSERQQKFLDGISKTISMLKGLVSNLNEKLTELCEDTTARIRTAFEGLDLHPRIGAVCVNLCRDGHYRNAVQDASIALVHLVKETSRRHDLDGAPLMRTVFSKNNPILAFNELKDQSDFDEQEGMMHLFEGAVMALRNPRAHDLSVDSPELAVEYIAFLSLLAKRVEQAIKVKHV